jgi:hypothetical protein
MAPNTQATTQQCPTCNTTTSNNNHVCMCVVTPTRTLDHTAQSYAPNIMHATLSHILSYTVRQPSCTAKHQRAWINLTSVIQQSARTLPSTYSRQWLGFKVCNQQLDLSAHGNKPTTGLQPSVAYTHVGRTSILLRPQRHAEPDLQGPLSPAEALNLHSGACGMHVCMMHTESYDLCSVLWALHLAHDVDAKPMVFVTGNSA